ncbi:urease accessory protein UreD [Paracoccus seriniphilus]|uniref:Urease accessory protein UreD n=1 Tax=Paracoccus seriniphilus TaxID=184748 RepID=A0A239PLV6_9RHOB|nr:urease accessory protein UreD [Paracoccus seriniphilus]WCR13624.1 urease accessory protein UreD [Paracoccus seriniphilus]SNT68782.1 urease accessory protein [Paracoccus seriniphilus]
MFDSDALAQAMQRSRGHAAVIMGPRGLIDLAQSGSAKAMLPRVTSGLPEVVFLNTSGGLASGDRLGFSLDLRAGTRAQATTQTAERAYRAKGSPAHAEVSVTVGTGGWLDWLPQETILFDGARLERHTRVDLQGDAGCMILETVMLGRLACGEQLRHLHLRDRREVRRDGQVIHHDALALDDGVLERRANPALLGEARVMATLAIIAPHAPDLLHSARAELNEPGVIGAASAPPGRLVLRLLARDDWPLRRQLNRLLDRLRPDPLPRIWQI